ncbi:MAG TPA: divergent polysaccharide deacetylase family protein [Thermoanaerobaculia bacterium]|jgi:hypothetical protein|nr:divergent polysaccharide deacetylase family protein [Thermoanaerobaculia bacterium]
MPNRRPRPKRSGLAGLWLFLLGALAGAGILYLACDLRGPRREESSAERETTPSPRKEQPEKPPRHAGPEHREPAPPPVSEATPSASSVPAEGTPVSRPSRVALVIDDLGRSTDDLIPLARLGVTITYAVLPFEENTPAVVEQLRSQRKEILLHLPMQPKHGENPGPGALRLGMTDGELRNRTLAALQAVPGAVGVNNHMGSGLSADARSMNAILQVLSARGLFFLDSRTGPDSVGYRTALALGVPAAERQVFLDSDPGIPAAQEQFRRLLEVARTRGAAVAIGHPHPDTLAMLAEEVPRAKAQGVDFVPVSYLLDRGSGPE